MNIQRIDATNNAANENETENQSVSNKLNKYVYVNGKLVDLDALTAAIQPMFTSLFTKEGDN